MVNQGINYGHETFSPERLSVAIDFSREKVINDPNYSAELEEVQISLINLTQQDKVVRPIRDKIMLGSYLEERDLKTILKKDTKDKSYFHVMRAVKKTDKLTEELAEDFELITDFFPIAIVTEVRNYVQKIIPKVEAKLLDQQVTFTPRKRRTLILAVFRSICRKNGRSLTEEVLNEINARFKYSRFIKLKDVFRWENKLIQLRLLAKSGDAKDQLLQNFYLHVLNHFKLLEGVSEILSDEKQTIILQETKKQLLTIVKDTDKRDALKEMIKHKDNDFAARMIIWSLAKHQAKKLFEITFRNPEDHPGWKQLFFLDIASTEPIRSWKYIFWNEFQIHKELFEKNLVV